MVHALSCDSRRPQQRNRVEDLLNAADLLAVDAALRRRGGGGEHVSAHADSAHRSHITLAASPTPATYDMSKNTTGFFFDMVSSWKLAVDHCTLVSEARFFHRAAHARRRRTTNNITIIWIMGAGPSLRLEDMLPLAALHQTLRRVRAHAITPCACPDIYSNWHPHAQMASLQRFRIACINAARVWKILWATGPNGVPRNGGRS